MTKVNVKTDVSPDGVISTNTYLHYNDGSWHELGRQVVDTRDAQIRQALIALGWTPPIAVAPPVPPGRPPIDSIVN